MDIVKDIPVPFEGTRTVEWKSPSNIALVKYWGKHGIQLPRNPSVSFTLQQSSTLMRVDYRYQPSDKVALDFYFEGIHNDAFGQKIIKFLQSVVHQLPFIPYLHFTVHSSNTFPHSAGIASSASSMSALALCLCSIEQQLYGTLSDQNEFLKKASWLARIASGSASRSVYPFAAAWGASGALDGSSDEYAVSVGNKLHEVFKTYHDSILIVNPETKKVSSRAGHALMNTHPYADVRYLQAYQNFEEMITALETGDLDTFIDITETEALSLHAMMMISGYTLLHPNSLAVIEQVKEFRRQQSIPLAFTLDAGPNVHLLYPHEYAERVTQFIENDLSVYCTNNQWLDDSVGSGPVQVS